MVHYQVGSSQRHLNNIEWKHPHQLILFPHSDYQRSYLNQWPLHVTQKNVKSHLHLGWMYSAALQVSSYCREQWHLGAPLLAMWPVMQREGKAYFKLRIDYVFMYKFTFAFISKVPFVMLLTSTGNTGWKFKTELLCLEAKCSLVLWFTASRDGVPIFHLVIINFP